MIRDEITAAPFYSGRQSVFFAAVEAQDVPCFHTVVQFLKTLAVTLQRPECKRQFWKLPASVGANNWRRLLRKKRLHELSRVAGAAVAKDGVELQGGLAGLTACDEKRS